MMLYGCHFAVYPPFRLLSLTFKRCLSYEMFARMLTVHCDQSDSYEITINGFKVRKINEIGDVIFGLR